MIKVNSVKKRIKERKPILMGSVCINDPSTAEIMALSGIHLIMIDNEHMAFDDSQIINIARAIKSNGSACLLRTAIKDVEKLSRYMEFGIDGFCATQTHNLMEAKNIIKAVKYPPVGNRGLCNYSKGFNYGILDSMSTEKFMNHANDNTIIFITLEDEKAIEDVEEIAKLEEVDSVHIGPNDLSASMGYGGNPKRQEVLDVIRKAEEKIIASGNTTAYHIKSPDEIPIAIEKGGKILYIGADMTYLRNALAGFGRAFKE